MPLVDFWNQNGSNNQAGERSEKNAPKMVTGADEFESGSQYMAKHLRYDDYLSKEHRITGHWWGKGCQYYGVEAGREVSQGAFNRLRDNKHAVTKEQVTVMNDRTREKPYRDKETGEWKTHRVSVRKPFFDCNIGATKTISIAAGPGKSQLAAECHNRGAEMVRIWVQQMTGRQAHNRRQHVELTYNAVMSVWQHHHNRSLEPHLHDHCIVDNMTRAANGNDYAVEFGEFMNNAGHGLLTAAYNDHCHAAMLECGMDVALDQYGAPQIRQLLPHKAVSQERTVQLEGCREQIEEFVGVKLSDRQAKDVTRASRGIDVEKFKRMWTESQPHLESLKRECLEARDAQTAGRKHRKLVETLIQTVRDASQKDLLPSSPREVEQKQLSSLTPEMLETLHATVATFKQGQRIDGSRDIVEDIEFAVKHLFERRSVVHQYDLYAEIYRHGSGKGIDMERMIAEVAARRDLVRSINGEVTTLEHLEHSVGIIKAIERGVGRGVAIPAREVSQELNESQRAAVMQLLQSLDRVTILSGLYGTGKTFSLKLLVSKNIEAGHQVIVCSPTIKSRNQLRQAAGELEGASANVFSSAITFQRFLADKKLQASLGQNDLIIVDEASLASSKQLYDFLRWGEQKGCRQMIVGDPTQIHSVDAGDGFRMITQIFEKQTARIEKIIRQKLEALNGHYLKAMQLFGRDKMQEGFWELHKAGAIKEIKGPERIEAYARSVLKSLDGTCPAVASNLTHRENDLVAESVRRKLQDQGKLADEWTLKVHRSLAWTVAEKREIKRLQPGMVLEMTQGEDLGRTWKVLRVEGGKAVAESRGEQRTFTRAQASAFDVCVERQIGVAIGDHLVANAGRRDRYGDISNGDRFVVASRDGFDNPVSVDGKVITGRNLSYGYSTTAIKVQSETEQKAIFGMDRHSIRQVSRQVVKVGSSRGWGDIEVFVENVADLARIEKRSGDRKDPLEIQLDASTIEKEMRPNVQALFSELQRIQGNRGDPEKVLEMVGELDLQAGINGHHIDRSDQGRRLEPLLEEELATVDLQAGARKNRSKQAMEATREAQQQPPEQDRGIER